MVMVRIFNLNVFLIPSCIRKIQEKMVIAQFSWSPVWLLHSISSAAV